MSTLNVANITDGTDTVETGYVVNGSAKAWVNFDGTGTVAIRDSLNVASITDNAVSDYTVTLTNAFAAATYAFTFGVRSEGSVGANYLSMSNGNVPTTTSFRIFAVDSNASNVDTPTTNTVLHGDLA